MKVWCGIASGHQSGNNVYGAPHGLVVGPVRDDSRLRCAQLADKWYPDMEWRPKFRASHSLEQIGCRLDLGNTRRFLGARQHPVWGQELACGIWIYGFARTY